MSDEIQEALWDERQAARFLNVSQEFLQQDRAGARRVPHIKVGRAVRYDPRDLRAFVEANKSAPRAGA